MVLETIPVPVLKKAMNNIGYSTEVIQELYELVEILMNLPKDGRVIKVEDLTDEDIGKHVRLFNRDGRFRSEGVLLAYHKPVKGEDDRWVRDFREWLVVLDREIYDTHAWITAVVTEQKAEV